jgi:hypothetical protein
VKRDLEIIIEVLKQVEANEDSRRWIVAKSTNHSFDAVQYNVRLMNEDGLIDVANTSSYEGESYMIKGLTWHGHDFLDAARNDLVVEKAKETAKSKGFDFKALSIDIAKNLLVETTKTMLFGT